MAFERCFDFARDVPIDTDNAHGVAVIVAIHARVQLNVLQCAVDRLAAIAMHDLTIGVLASNCGTKRCRKAIAIIRVHKVAHVFAATQMRVEA